MNDYRKYFPEIIKRIGEVNPYKIILFGSYANGNFHEDSDLDLIVVLDSSKIAQNYDEKMENRLLVSKKIFDIQEMIPIDLLVYTKGEFEIISQSGSPFCNEIENTGKVIYEKNN